MTHDELHILKHATAWPKNYRNYFVTDNSTFNWHTCETLVARGLMDKTIHPFDEANKTYIFRVTAKGFSILKESVGTP